MSDSEKKFPCTMCGMCCTFADAVVKNAKTTGQDLGYDFPINEDGSCGHRIPMVTPEGRATHGCEIYETRPPICDLERNVPHNMSRKEYFRASMMACNVLQIDNDIDPSFRVIIEET